MGENRYLCQAHYTTIAQKAPPRKFTQSVVLPKLSL
jgi:hypothetical protein